MQETSLTELDGHVVHESSKIGHNNITILYCDLTFKVGHLKKYGSHEYPDSGAVSLFSGAHKAL